MKKQTKKGFTLIELLVVIAIIALLLSVIMPALRAAKEQARKIICLSHLSQLAKALELYAFEYNYKRISIRNDESEVDTYWMGKLADYAGNESYTEFFEEGSKIDLLLCPSAPYNLYVNDPDLTNASGQYGSAKKPWEWNRSDGMSTIGSYTMNAWMGYDYYYEDAATYAPYYYKDMLNVAPNVPLFADGVWPVSWPRGADMPPTTLQGSPASELPADTDNMRRVCIARHKKQVNIVYRDSHVESCDLKDLWNLRWHKDYQAPATEIALPTE